jgi:hypothetical protein
MVKPRKTDGAATGSASKPPPRGAPPAAESLRRIDDRIFRRAANRVFQTHRKLLENLTQ